MSEQLEPELERVARMLAAAGPLPDAPVTLRERALRIPDGDPAPEQEAEAEAAPTARRRFRRPRPIALAGLAAAVAAIIIVPAVAIMRDDGGSSVHRVDLAPRSFAPQGGGAANVVRHGDGTSEIKLTVWKMPSAGHGRTYEAWLGRKGDRWPLGTFSTDTNGKATITFRVSRKDVNNYRWLWVTSEPSGGSKKPSEDTALWGPLT
jgi:anti-sigma-K factor RskA